MSRNRKTFSANDLLDQIARGFQTTEVQLTGTITIHRMLIAFCGALELAVMLQFIIYHDSQHAGKRRIQDGDEPLSDEDRDTFVVTVDQLEAETGLSQYWTYKALNILEDVGLIEQTRRARYGKHPGSKVHRRFRFNRFIELLEAFIEDPSRENALYRTYRGLDEAAEDPDRDTDAHFYSIPSTTELLDDPDAALSEEWSEAIKWARSFKELRHASDQMKHWTYVLAQVTGGEDGKQGVTPRGVSKGRWYKEMETIILAAGGDLEIARTGFMLAWSYATRESKQHWYTYPLAFLKFVRQAKAQSKRRIRQDIKQDKKRAAADGKEKVIDEGAYTEMTYDEILALQSRYE